MKEKEKKIFETLPLQVGLFRHPHSFKIASVDFEKRKLTYQFDRNHYLGYTISHRFIMRIGNRRYFEFLRRIQDFSSPKLYVQYAQHFSFKQYGDRIIFYDVLDHGEFIFLSPSFINYIHHKYLTEDEMNMFMKEKLNGLLLCIGGTESSVPYCGEDPIPLVNFQSFAEKVF